LIGSRPAARNLAPGSGLTRCPAYSMPYSWACPVGIAPQNGGQRPVCRTFCGGENGRPIGDGRRAGRRPEA